MADRTSSDITVAAPAPVIMSVIADFAAYPDWATGVRSAQIVGSGADGLPARVRFNLDAGVIRDSYVLAYDWDADAGVRWELDTQGSMISQMSGGYRLVPAGDGTRVTYELEVGLKVPMIGMLKRRAEKTIIDTALRGLRARAESMPGGGNRV